MPLIATDLRETRESARRIRFEPVSPITATDVQTAIVQVETIGAVTPPAIVPTSIAVAQSPYTVLATDYLIVVDTVGGAVTINMMAAGARANLPIEIKDGTGHAQANNISVVANGAETSDGLATYLIASDFDAKTFKPQTGGYLVI